MRQGVKDRRGNKKEYEYLLQWVCPHPDSWHRERYLPSMALQQFKDECVKFIVRRYKWQQYLFE